MRPSSPAFAFALLFSSACGAVPEDAKTTESELTYREDRQRTCAQDCAVGTVCDTALNACVSEPAPPSFAFPVAGARVAGRPELRFVTDSSATDSVVEICADSSCTNVVAKVNGADGAVLAQSLPRGSYFARAYGRRARADGTFIEGATSTETRVFFSSGRDVPSGGMFGLEPDLDSDGHADVVIGNSFLQYGYSEALTARLSSGSSPSLVPLPYSAILAGDLDGDGLLELVAAKTDPYSYPPPTSVTLGRAQWDPKQKKFVARPDIVVPIPAGESFAYVVALGDVDGDGLVDIGAVRNLPHSWLDAWTTLATGVSVHIVHGGRGAAPFRTSELKIEIPENDRPYQNTSITVRSAGDVDGDGRSDLIVASTLRGRASTTPCDTRPHAFVEIRRGGTDDAFPVLTRYESFTSVDAVGDVNGDGYADFILSRGPRELRGLAQGGDPSCEMSYRITGEERGQLRVVLGGPTTPLSEVSWEMPEESEPGCNNGWRYSNRWLVGGSAVGGGDLDGDGLDDIAFVSSESHPGGQRPCESGGARIRILALENGAVSIRQTLAGPDGSRVGFASRVAFIAKSSDRDSLLVTSVARPNSSSFATWTSVAAKVRIYEGTSDELTPVSTFTSGQNIHYNDGFGDNLVGAAP